METESNTRDHMGPLLSPLPDETLVNIRNFLSKSDLAHLSQTCSYLKSLCAEPLHEFKKITVKNLLHDFNDCFKKALPLEDPDLTQSLLDLYQDLKKKKFETTSQRGLLQVISDIDGECNLPFISKEMNQYQELFIKKRDEIKSENPAPKFDESKKSIPEPVIETSFETLTFAEQQKQIAEVIKVIKLHYLSSLYAKNNQALFAWYVAFKASDKTIFDGHLSAFITSLHYLSLLEREDYQQAAQIIFCHFTFQRLTVDEIILIENRDKIINSLIDYWVESSNFLPKHSSQDYLLLLKIKFKSLNKSDQLYKATSNLITNFKAAFAKYGDLLFTNLDKMLPYLIHCKNIARMVNNLTIEELLNLDAKLIDILNKSIPETQINACVNFIKNNYLPTTVTKIINCAYPELIFIHLHYNRINKIDSSNQTSILDNIILILNTIYKKHYGYSHGDASTENNQTNYAIHLMQDKNFAKVSAYFAATVMIFYVMHSSNETVMSFINLFLNYSFDCAKYINHLLSKPAQLGQLAKCQHFLQFFSRSRGHENMAQFKQELEFLYAIHFKLDAETAKKFYQEKIALLPDTHIDAVLVRMKILSNVKTEVDRFFYIFEKDMSYIFCDAKLECVIKSFNLEDIINLYEIKNPENISYLEQCIDINADLLQHLQVCNHKSLAGFQVCVTHPMIKKINYLNKEAQSNWLNIHYGLVNMSKGKISLFSFLNMLDNLDKTQLIGWQKIASNSLSLFDYFTNLGVPQTFKYFCLPNYLYPDSDYSISETNLQLINLSNSILLDKLDFAELKQVYTIDKDLLDKFSQCEDFPEIQINLQFVCKYIEKNGKEDFFNVIQEFKNKPSNSDSDHDDNDIFAYLVTKYNEKSEQQTDFQFFPRPQSPKRKSEQSEEAKDSSENPCKSPRHT